MDLQKGLHIGARYFKTKAQAESFIRCILNSYKNGQWLKGPDLEFALAIYHSHQNIDSFKKLPIKAVFIQWLEGGEKRFACRYSDDSIRDFTWHHLLHKRSPFERVAKVCRWLIKDQTEKARAAAFAADIALTCPVSGRRITRDECDVDHEAPRTFQALVEGWLKSNHMTADEVEIIASPAYQEPDRFQDVFLAENWRDYHKFNARLRVVHPVANRSILRKGKQ